jgi:tetratricopeptide (TPR) repeat protein
MKMAPILTTVPVCFLAVLFLFCACGGKKEPKDEAERALDDARGLAEKGDYAGALEKQVWFHNNALAVRPGYYGVRLSFALADWVELGKKYPPAMEKLKSIRDEKAARLSAGAKDRDLFDDVVSINEYVGEPKKTIELFRRIDASDAEFASKVYELADAALLGGKEYELARKHLGDPTVRFARAKAEFERGMRYAKEKKSDASRQAFEHIFTDEVVRIVTVLQKTGDRDAAKLVQNDALSVLNSPGIREALKPQ